MTRVGIIGAGRYGRFLIETLRTVEDVTLTAVVGSVEATAQATAARYGIPYWSADYRAMLAQAPVDLVVVASPPYLHAEMAAAALAAGKHVLLEKPPVLTLADCDRLCRLAADAGRVVAVDYHMRFNPLYRAVGRLLATRALGALTRVAVDNLASDEPLAPSHWFWDPARSGGIFVEHGVHFFDVFEQLLGRPAVLLARIYQRPDGPVDRAYCAVEYPGAIFATFCHSFDRPYEIERTVVRLVFDRGVVELHGWVPLRLEGGGATGRRRDPRTGAGPGRRRRAGHRAVRPQPHGQGAHPVPAVDGGAPSDAPRHQGGRLPRRGGRAGRRRARRHRAGPATGRGAGVRDGKPGHCPGVRVPGRPGGRDGPGRSGRARDGVMCRRSTGTT
ncbi:MAG: Gfo/Idh/MocA family oxidoreductase [Armatimonadota bacterium]|nr:Gfo/Idh/MocA family oxidoreductase [Armatimonadota bacterium]